MIGAAPQLHYRPMRDADLDAVAQIEAQLHHTPWTRGNFADSLLAGHSCWVVEHEGELCAYGVLMMGVEEGHLLNITVAVPAQRRGIGRELLAFLEGRSRDFGARAMLLEVRPSNTAARALYRCAGYREHAVRRNYYPAPNGREDAILMIKSL